MTPDQAEAFIQERIEKLHTYLGEPAAAAFIQLFNLTQLTVIYASAATPLRESEPKEHAELTQVFNALISGIAANVLLHHGVEDNAERKIREYVKECLEAVTLANSGDHTKH
jgi:hypothetical protein